MKIGIIDNFDSFVYNLVRYIKEFPGTEVVVQRNSKIDYSVLDTCDAILLSPGPGIPSEAGDLLKVIERYSDSKSILGVCLGHQALGEHFGGTLKQCSFPIHGKSSSMKISNHESIFKSLPTEINIGRYHSWQVDIEKCEMLEEIGVTEDITMAFQHKSLPLYGMQFHPESILTPEGRTIINNWLEKLI